MQKLLFIVVTLMITHTGFSDEMPPEVKRLKELRDRQVAEKTKEIDTIYHRELNRLKKKYAAQGNYIAAAYIDKMLIDAIDTQAKNESLSNSEKETAAQNQDAKVYFKGDTMRLKEGVRVWGPNRTGPIKSVPDQFEGKKITALEAKPRQGKGGADPVHIPVPFKVKKAGIVYIIADACSSETFTKDGWKLHAEGTYIFSHNEKKYHILSKFLEAGEYTLPITEEFGTRLIIM